MKEGDNVICPLCGDAGEVAFVERQETVTVRGIEIPVTKIMRKSGCCDCEYENTKDHDWRREAFDKYREYSGIPSADDIRVWREDNNLTQAEASNLLGWGAATIGRYEKGSLPTTAQADQLKSVMSDDGLLKLLEEKPLCVNPTKMEALIQKLRAGALQAQYVKIIKDVHFTVDENFNGGCEFSFEKVASLASILSQFCETTTKLNKLFFYADFISNRILGSSITGMQYARINYGPVPERYATLYEGLNVLNIIQIDEQSISGYNYKSVSPGSSSREGALSDAEIQIANAVRNYFKDFNASQIADYSHQERAWLEVPNAERIAYRYADDLKNIDEILRFA